MFDGGGKYLFFLSGDEDGGRLSPSGPEEDRDHGRFRGPFPFPLAALELASLIPVLRLSSPDTVLRRTDLVICGFPSNSMTSGSESARELFSMEEVGDVDLAREVRRLRRPRAGPCALPTGCLFGDDSSNESARGRVGEGSVLGPACEVDETCLYLRLLPYVTFTGVLELDGSPNVYPPSDSGMGELSSCSAAKREAFCAAARRDI